jgi:hypothetical protein
MSIIKIRRSCGFAAPTQLALGEFGYAYGTGTQTKWRRQTLSGYRR